MRATGFDLNSHYPAVNMLAFLKAQAQLARRFPDGWAAQHDNDGEVELKRREELAERIRVNLPSRYRIGWRAAEVTASGNRNNLWMMFNALTTGATWRTLIALFNEEREPDGPGGTKHLLCVAREHGLRAVPVDGKPLLG